MKAVMLDRLGAAPEVRDDLPTPGDSLANPAALDVFVDLAQTWASGDAGFVSGAVMPVDGGWTAVLPGQRPARPVTP